MRLHILTAVTRPENLPQIGESIMEAASRGPVVFDLTWHRLEDPDRAHVGGQHLKNRMLNRIRDGWVCILDDDTLMHPAFLRKIGRANRQHRHVNAYVVSQRRTTGAVLKASPENMVVGSVDAGQVVLRRSLIRHHRIPETYGGDGQFIQNLLYGQPDVLYMPDVISLHNALSGIDVSETPERMQA